MDQKAYTMLNMWQIWIKYVKTDVLQLAKRFFKYYENLELLIWKHSGTVYLDKSFNLKIVDTEWAWYKCS